MTVRVVRQLAHDDKDIPAVRAGRAINGLYKLALHFGYERRPFHDAPRGFCLPLAL